MRTFKVIYTLKDGTDIYDIVKADSEETVMKEITRVISKPVSFIIIGDGGFRLDELLRFKVLDVKLELYNPQESSGLFD